MPTWIIMRAHAQILASTTIQHKYDKNITFVMKPTIGQVYELLLSVFSVWHTDKHHNIPFIIIIVKKGQQCKAGRELYTPYQSEDPSPTIPTYRQKEEKGKESRRL